MALRQARSPYEDAFIACAVTVLSVVTLQREKKRR
ncbi:hypothetical protein R69919_02734 [Paraburkholderia gardini]|uniref:Uncharacterized protein n=1 Tax=Paraburkholderia gardini TaxID=2823469 RepID=A0ABM8U3I1_9BURK|nr:hypothetical protein R54767_02439 [Paraburkholderia gardini]CAG4900441.1 hypothetical protein R69919_02734 [Paraburkholderia gardini]